MPSRNLRPTLQSENLESNTFWDQIWFLDSNKDRLIFLVSIHFFPREGLYTICDKFEFQLQLETKIVFGLKVQSQNLEFLQIVVATSHNLLQIC